MRRILLHRLVFGLMLCTHSLSAQSSYVVNHKALTQQLKMLATNYPGLIQVESIGQTGEGRDIWAVKITRSKDPHPPALAVIANIEGPRLFGTAAAIHTIEALAKTDETDPNLAALLRDNVVYVIPCLNADGAELYFNPVKHEIKSNATARDEDFDGLVDEDGCDDLNNDGMITLMRRKEPGGKWIVDPDDARLLKKADVLKGEHGIYTLYLEGIDDDGDGRFNEDGPGGINLNRNFPHEYPYNEPDAGAFMTSEPEVRALLDFFFNHRNIALVYNFSEYDNIREMPRPANKKPPGGFSRTLVTEMDKDDLAFFKSLVDKFKKNPSLSEVCAPFEQNKPLGAFHQWTYFQYGIFGISTPAWLRPAERDTSQSKAKGKPASKDNQDMAWLTWFDQNNSSGYAAWTPFKHPQLGDVEIGGFIPYARTLPPSLDTGLIQGHTDFIRFLCTQLPHLRIADLTIEAKADKVYHVKVTVQNEGFLPTVLQHAEYAQAVMPTRVRLEGNHFSLLTGTIHTLIPSLQGSGDTSVLEWTIQAEAGTKIIMNVWSEKAGSLTRSLTLK